MFIVESYSLAVMFCIVTMLCWGSWANTQKIVTGRWRFELFYWDYVIGILLCSLLAAFTLGSSGEHGRSFLADLQQASTDNLSNAFVGGIVFNLANILLTAAIAIAGMSVAFPIGIGIAFILGVVINYSSVQKGDPVLLFTGVVLVAIAIILNAVAYKKKSAIGHKPGTKGILLTILAGILMSFFYRFIAGPAISYGLGQGATLIAAIWGVIVWKEFKNSPKQVSLLLGGMFIFSSSGSG